jgi:hypothetical protein
MRSPIRVVLLVGVLAALGLCVSACSPSGTPSAGATAASSAATTPEGTTTTPTPSTSSSSTAIAIPDPVDPALRDKLAAVCDQMVAFNLAHQWEDVYVYSEATAETLPIAAAHLDAEPVNHDLRKIAAALGTPTKGVASWTRLMAGFSRYAETASDQIAAAKAGNLKHYLETVATIASVDAAVREDLRVAGFHANDSCTFLFEPPKGHFKL